MNGHDRSGKRRQRIQGLTITPMESGNTIKNRGKRRLGVVEKPLNFSRWGSHLVSANPVRMRSTHPRSDSRQSAMPNSFFGYRRFWGIRGNIDVCPSNGNSSSGHLTGEKNRRMVLVKGCAGLGNRILALLTASLFAVLTKRRLLIDWRDATYTGRGDSAPDLFSNLFVSPLADPLPDVIVADSVAPALWQGRVDEGLDAVGRDYDPVFYKKFGSFRKLAVSLRKLDYDEEMLVFWSFREVMTPLRPHLIQMDSRYRKMSNAEILKEAAGKYLHPNERVRSIVSQFKSDHFNKRMLGLHIRATDLMAPVEKLLKLAREIAKKENCDGVFCATDNAEVEDRARRLLPNLVTLPKQMATQGIPLHYDPECKDRVERATQALVDMLLLAECPNLLFASRSSFAYVATMFSPIKQAIVDVDRYNPKIVLKRIAQSWVY